MQTFSEAILEALDRTIKAMESMDKNGGSLTWNDLRRVISVYDHLNPDEIRERLEKILKFIDDDQDNYSHDELQKRIDESTEARDLLDDQFFRNVDGITSIQEEITSLQEEINRRKEENSRLDEWRKYFKDLIVVLKEKQTVKDSPKPDTSTIRSRNIDRLIEEIFGNR